jgi:hypothetical protein
MWAKRSLPALVALPLGLASCAREAVPPDVPGMRETPPPAEARALPVRRHHAGHGDKSLHIPDGEACLAWLAAEGIAYRPLAPRPGMKTPVAVTGPIGGVRYETAGHTLVVCDCRLAVALDWLGPELRSFGVTEVRHSGAYVYRTTHSGRPSLHAQGLAIDLHGLRMQNRRLEVDRDFVRGEGRACAPDSPPLNRLACELGRTGLFEEVITPDDDSDHRDHLHLAIAPL